MQINFYNFAKPDNSTARPVGDGESVAGELREDFSLLQLQTPIARTDPTKAPTWNYAFIPQLRRYYYINGWVYSGGRWICDLVCDVLATWRDEIRQQRLYVTRSSSQWDGTIPDTMYPVTAAAATQISSSVANTLFGTPTLGGWYIFGILGSGSRCGVIDYYAMSTAQAVAFMTYLMGSNSYMGISSTEISAELQKGLINPMQYIMSCRYFPGEFTEITGGGFFEEVTSIKIGWWSLSTASIWGAGGSVARVTAIIATAGADVNLTIPKHPAGYRGQYLTLAPWASYKLTALPWGSFSIDPGLLAGRSTLHINVRLSFPSGMALLRVYTDSADKPILTSKARWAYDMPLAQITASPTMGALTRGALAAGITAFNQAGGLPGIMDRLTDAAVALTDRVFGIERGNQLPELPSAQDLTQIGSAAGAAASSVDYTGADPDSTDLWQRISLVGVFYQPAPEDLSHRGRPLCKIVRLGDLTGFVQCSHADIAMGCSRTETQAIRSFLEGGMLLE